MQNKKRIMIIDNDQNMTDSIKTYFEQCEFDVVVIDDTSNLEELLKTDKPNLILLEIILPDVNGLDVLKKVQKDTDIPVVILTSKNDEIDKIIGLELGAYDYITKPFSYRELIARIRNILRRTFVPTKLEVKNKRNLVYHNVVIMPDKRVLRIDDKEIDLTKTEFEILFLLASNPNKTFSREELIKAISERNYATIDRSIDMHISHLRSKLERVETNQYCFIKTVWGSGYRFEVLTDDYV